MSHNSIKTFVILITVLGISCIAGAFAGCLCKICEKIVARKFYPTASPPKFLTSKMHFFCAHRAAPQTGLPDTFRSGILAGVPRGCSQGQRARDGPLRGDESNLVIPQSGQPESFDSGWLDWCKSRSRFRCCWTQRVQTGFRISLGLSQSSMKLSGSSCFGNSRGGFRLIPECGLPYLWKQGGCPEVIPRAFFCATTVSLIPLCRPPKRLSADVCAF